MQAARFWRELLYNKQREMEYLTFFALLISKARHGGYIENKNISVAPFANSFIT